MDNDGSVPIAIIGLSFTFPGNATSPESFWDMLIEGRNVTKAYPEDRFNYDAFHGSNLDTQGTISSSSAHFIEENIAAFDAPFFSMTHAEAAALDPQQRGLLESSYRALENAGIPMERVRGTQTSVHAGCFTADYASLFYKNPEQMPKYTATGVAGAMISNRISWFFDLHGPSVTIDTACSSSMVALDQACQLLRARKTSMGLVAGCNLIYSPDLLISLSNMGFLSPDGRCYSFDSRANGYARGEGIAVIVVKRLCDAIENGDTIRAVIRGTGTNQDGHTPGVTQPSKEAQESLIRQVYNEAKLELSTTRYVEAHGTATLLGDPIEANAISSAFSHQRPDDEPLYIGSVKANIGHLEATSGLAGLIKTVLILERGIIPPIADFQKLNAQIDEDFLNIKFPSKCVSWPTAGLRRASVNSFGFGGTNAHAVLDDAYNYLSIRGLKGNHNTTQLPPLVDDAVVDAFISSSGVSRQSLGTNDTSLDGSFQQGDVETFAKLLVWSASDEKTLSRMTAAYSRHLHNMSSVGRNSSYIHSLAHTLGSRRSKLAWKSFAFASSSSDVRDLESILSQPIRSLDNPKLGYIFTGQGAQWHGMGRELLGFPTFRESLEESESHLKALGCEWSLTEELLKDEINSRINEPAFSQPICTALQIALASLLKSFGLLPTVVVGHSSGEICAAYAVGAISKLAALRIAYHRGRLSQGISPEGSGESAMLAVSISQVDVLPYIASVKSETKELKLHIACINSPRSITISGDPVQINRLKEILDEHGEVSRKLLVNVAYHSPYMQAISSEYRSSLQNLEIGERHDRSCIMISSVTGKPVSIQELRTADYWVKNMVSKVQFSDAVNFICANSRKKVWKKLDGSHRNVIVVDDLLEIGPHCALRGPIRDILTTTSRSSEIQYDSLLVRKQSAIITLFRVLGSMYCKGYSMDLNCINEQNSIKRQNRTTLPDLPEYTFDHSQKYWNESRISRNLRFRKYPRSELLGTSEMDWNPFEAKWNNIMKPSEVPWLGDHVVNNVLLLPAAGMITMAIEAAKQLSGNVNVARYELKDITFPSALQISSVSTGVETQFFLRPLRNSQDKDNSWAAFRLFVLQNDTWTETCRGTIQSVLDEHGNQSPWTKLPDDISNKRQFHEDTVESCSEEISSEKLYQSLERSGLQYGPTFQSMRQIRYGTRGEAAAVVKTFVPSINTGSSCGNSYIVHPSTLDGAFQVIFAGLQRQGAADIPTMIPSRIQRLAILSSGFNSCDTETVEVSTQMRKTTFRTVEASVLAFSSADKRKYIHVEGLEMTAVTKSESSSEISGNIEKLCYSIAWIPDLGLMDSEQVAEYCHASVDEPDDFYDQLAFVLFVFISRSLQDLKSKQIDLTASYLQNYLSWMQAQVKRFTGGILPNWKPEWTSLLQDIEYQDLLISRLENLNAQGALFVKVGKSLTKVLSGEIEPLKILFEGDLAKSFYQDLNRRSSCYASLGRYLDCLAHKRPGMKILEVGAGTGATTELILESLMGCSKVPRYSRYDFSDISASFLEKAQETFSEHSSMGFRVLDIERDICEQGFEGGSYDLLIAANILHATRDLGMTVSNVRKLLKPTGTLVLVEVTVPELLWVGFAFGLLPGWWLSSESYRQESPIISEETWNKVLLQNGFSGTDHVFRDFESRTSHTFSIMVSTAVEVEAIPLPPTTTIFISEKPERYQLQAFQTLKKKLSENRNESFEVASLKDAVVHTQTPDPLFVFLDDNQAPLLKGLDIHSFQALQILLQSTRKLLWITGGGGTKPATAEFGQVQGLCRVSREENHDLQMVIIALENLDDIDDSTITQIGKVSEQMARDPSSIEAEYAQRGGILHLSRVVEGVQLNDTISTRRSKHHQKVSFGGSVPLKMCIGTLGLLDTLHFTNDYSHLLPLADHEIEVEVKAIGANFLDVLVALGRVDSATIGGECAGIVRRVSPNAVSKFKVGDRVVFNLLGVYKSYVRVNELCVHKIPDELSFAVAAAVPTNFVTVLHALFYIGRLQAGESILIHSAAGGTGQVAVQIAQHLEAEVYATVGTEDKKKLLMERYEISEDHIFSSRDVKFAQGIKAMTKGMGVDVVLNSLSGEGLVASWECVAAYGHFIEIGKKDIYARSNLPMWQFSKNTSFSGFDLMSMLEQRPKIVGDTLGTALDMIKENKASIAYPLHEFQISEVEKAFRFIQTGTSSGKVVITVAEDDEVSAILETDCRYTFDSESTYIVAGGLGGIGRSASRWMVSRGVRYLILLSRSGAQAQESIDLVEELGKGGVTVETPPCDVSDAAKLESVLADCALRLPPIKGCIQASMVLRDSMITNMTFDQWKASTTPKVEGSWNLHMLLPKGMDFFILLSSISGVIGSPGQANYAAGNTYQDALARYRVAQGEKAISLDLGLIAQEGFLAENKSAMSQLQRRTRLRPVSQDSIFHLLDHYCDPLLPIATPTESQVVIGLETPANIYAKGYELPHYLEQPIFRYLHQSDHSNIVKMSGGGQASYTAQFAAAATVAEAQEIACNSLVQKISRILSISEEEIDSEKPMHRYGVDSLLAVELRTWVSKEFNADVAIFEILGGATFSTIAGLIARRRIDRNTN
ncbi:hypothetical protein HYFRA_00010779 [Hymenoscyphus fraxineus]|uniref:Polyketide synthase n=1 Tax=Hymenoscyphus fraxineus TaxID=746836 RepID=A0A9N9PW34_9HELO|nr:hypothetical protein HYFRA_00010779 [Hymenoscyphus fraxineus]